MQISADNYKLKHIKLCPKLCPAILIRMSTTSYISIDFEPIRQIVREELESFSVGTRLAYSVPELAALTGLSSRQIDKHIDRGDLTAKFSGTKRIIPVDEAHRFVRELPDEDRGPL